MQNECHILPCICGIQKNGMDDLIFKAEIETQREKKMFRYQNWKGGGMNWEIGIDIYTLIDSMFKTDNWWEHTE